MNAFSGAIQGQIRKYCGMTAADAWMPEPNSLAKKTSFDRRAQNVLAPSCIRWSCKM
jgi:hypothetical protein